MLANHQEDLKVLQEGVIAQAEETGAAVPAVNCNNSNCFNVNIR